MKLYDESAVRYLQLQQTPTDVNGLPVIVKTSPTEPRPGHLDLNELDIMKSHWIARDNARNDEAGEMPAKDAEAEGAAGGTSTEASPQVALQAMRDGMGFPNRNLNTVEIHTGYETLRIGDNDVGVWRYYPRKKQREGLRPCFVFLHGGGWIGGSPYTVENPCRLIAELADAVVFNVDYSLAPENKYPNGFEDCHGVVRHIHDHAEAYGVDKGKIAVGGDSAGGNLTAAVATRDRDEGAGLVALQVLMYACVVMKSGGVPGYVWQLSDYEIAPEQAAMIDPLLGIGRPKGDEVEILMGDMYLTDPAVQVEEPYVSPLLTPSYAGLPRTLSVAAEYDGLRIQDEEYARRLHAAGVPVKSIRYRGVTHAFIDRLGFVPQAEDLCREIAQALRDL
jgi:acetyl esterase/lipase